MKTPKSGGGWKAIGYTLKLARKVGWFKMIHALRSKNTCKTCAVGMGGQLGGMVNEGGYFPEVCKKSFQAIASDLQPAISEEFWSKYSIHQLQAMTSRQLENSGRIVQPVLLQKGETHFRPISWDEALQKTSAAMKQAGPNRSFFYASGRSSNEAGFLLQLMSRLFGTNYVNNCSFYCHQASGVGLGSSLGTGAGTIRLDDLRDVDLYILIGANPASNHPRLMKSLMEIRRHGGKVIVVNPVKELGLVNFRIPSDVRSLLFGSEIASTYLQPNIGGDIFWLLGVAKEIFERDAHNQKFIEEHTEQFEAFRKLAVETDWKTIIAGSGLTRDQIADIAGQYLNSTNTVIGWCMGVTHHLHGTNTVQMIANVALLRGMVGRRRAGLMPIRGHSNVQGMGSVGVTPQLKTAMLQRFEKELGIEVPKGLGYDTMSCMEAADRGEMDFAFNLGGNLFGSNPDMKFAQECFGKIKTVAYLSTTLNTGHAFGLGEDTLILPVLPRDEEFQPTTQESMFSYVRMSDGGKALYAGPRSEVQILAKIAQQALPSDGPVDFKELESHSALRKLIAKLVPGYEEMMGLETQKREFYVKGRAVEEYCFPTESGRAKFHAPVLPDIMEGESTFRLMTVRSEGQFNSVVYDEEDLYRGQERRDIVLMNQADMTRLNLEKDQKVSVRNATGEMRLLLVRPFDVRAGNILMYYPEANVLVPRTVDPLSKTPGFKGVPVVIEPEDSAMNAVPVTP